MATTARNSRRWNHAEDIAIAGAIVGIGYDGELLIEHGLVRKDDAPKPIKASRQNAGEPEDATPDPARGYSQKLVTELTSYRTAGLAEALATQDQRGGATFPFRHAGADP